MRTDRPETAGGGARGAGGRAARAVSDTSNMQRAQSTRRANSRGFKSDAHERDMFKNNRPEWERITYETIDKKIAAKRSN